MAGLISNNNSNSSSNLGGLMAINYQLDNFASAPIRRSQQSNVLAVCFSDEAAKGPQCYVYSTCLSGSRACEQRRRVGKTSDEEEIALFIKDMKQFYPSSSTQKVADQPQLIRLEMNEDEKFNKDVKIDARLTITSTGTDSSSNNTWFGFVSEGALFLRGNGWEDMEIRESVVAALDLAEEQLGCKTVHLCLEKANPGLAKLVRTLMYAGFEMVHPAILPNANPKYLVMGMDL
ncbi:hypothetical protein BGZ83_008244 [Gryganskiella cystojenkinii]|nr:hypothetical protein BGZ83_008244 [Gryganskiella cystojenkinii]